MLQTLKLIYNRKSTRNYHYYVCAPELPVPLKREMSGTARWP